MSTCEKLPGSKAKLTITVDAAAFSNATQQAYFRNVSHYNIPGFRKGKAPRRVIETMYGPGVFFEDAFELIWADAYEAAVVEHELRPVDRPALDIETLSLDEGVVFTAEVQLRPEVTLGAYKGIEVGEPTYTVGDAEVDAELDKQRDKNARFIAVDRPAETGDRVTLDYAGSVDGVPFEGGTAEEQLLVLGSGSFIPGFEEQVVGMRAGEERDITVTFPAEYHAEHLAGKEAVFAIKLREIQIKEMPALDDEFAKDVSEFDTLDELRADIRKRLTETAEANKKTAVENRALDAVCRNATVELPDVMIQRQIDYLLQDIAYRLQRSGISLEDYCKYAGTDLATLRGGYREEAERRVKLQLVIEAVGKAEALACTPEEIDKVLAEIAESNGQTLEDFKKTLTADDLEYMTDRALAEKTVDLIVSAVKLVPEAEPSGAEEAAQAE